MTAIKRGADVYRKTHPAPRPLDGLRRIFDKLEAI
jgi:hypothetical protein